MKINGEHPEQRWNWDDFMYRIEKRWMSDKWRLRWYWARNWFFHPIEMYRARCFRPYTR